MKDENYRLNDINSQVFELLEDLNMYGMKSAPRGQAVVEAMLCTLDIDPLYPIMSFPQRKFNWKYFAGELAWYLKREDTITFIQNFSTFWNGITRGGYAINSNYGHILFGDHPGSHFSDLDAHGDEVTDFRHPVNQMEWVYKSLKKDKFSRQAIAFLNSPYYQYEGNKDFVCTAYINFWIRHDRLDMKVQMRSNDIFFGLSYDAPWFSLIHQSMYLNLVKDYPDLKLGMYHHCADNIHYYERHFELVEQVLQGTAEVSPRVQLKHPLFTFDKNDKFQLSKQAEKFLKTIEAKVISPDFKTMTQESWKEQLMQILEITD